MQTESRIDKFERVSTKVAFVIWGLLGLAGFLAIGVYSFAKLVKFLWTTF
jgi:hypothetical protein